MGVPIITTARVVMLEVMRLSRRASRTTGSCRASAMLGRGLLRKRARTGRAMKAMARDKSSPRPALRAISLPHPGKETALPVP